MLGTIMILYSSARFSQAGVEGSELGRTDLKTSGSG